MQSSWISCLLVSWGPIASRLDPRECGCERWEGKFRAPLRGHYHATTRMCADCVRRRTRRAFLWHALCGGRVSFRRKPPVEAGSTGTRIAPSERAACADNRPESPSSAKRPVQPALVSPRSDNRLGAGDNWHPVLSPIVPDACSMAPIIASRQMQATNCSENSYGNLKCLSRPVW